MNHITLPATFARSVRRVKLPPPRLGPNVVVSTESVTLEAVQFAPALRAATAQPPTPDPPPAPAPQAPQPSAARRVKAQPFPNVCEVDTRGLADLELEIVRILSGSSAPVRRIVEQISVVRSQQEVQTILDGLIARGKLHKFIGKKMSVRYCLARSATDAPSQKVTTIPEVRAGSAVLPQQRDHVTDWMRAR